MKLGDDTILLRRRLVVSQDDYGNDVTENVDSEVRWCSVTPTTSSESDDRAVPRVSGLHLLAPAGTDVEAADAIGYRGRWYEVDGEAGIWDECVEAQLRRAT